MRNRIRQTMLLSLVPLTALTMVACSDDEEAKTPTDVSHDVESLQSEIDDMLKEIDEVDTLDRVSTDLLSE